MSINMIFSRVMLNQRISKNMTQSQAAERCGLSLRGYQKLESGRAAPTFASALYISNELDFSLDQIKNEVFQDDTVSAL